MDYSRVNIAFAWIWILLGFASGALLGMRFDRDTWMGGYASFPRRLYRLGHISFFGLGLINLLFAMTVRSFGISSPVAVYPSCAFLIGGVLMPICCLISAHFPNFKPAILFAAPVSSLLTGGALTLYLLTL